jgi:Domain of unknown function (DUF4170)
MANYWVVGAEYTDTSFRKLAPGAKEDRLGPYKTYREAYQAWQTRARATIDDACVRYRIVDADGKDARKRSTVAAG